LVKATTATTRIRYNNGLDRGGVW